MRRQGVLLFGVLGAAIAAGCGGNVILDSGGSGEASMGVGGAGVGGAGGAGPTSTGTLGGSGFSCDFMQAGIHVCAEYDNLPPADVQAEQSACTGEGGTSGTSCSSAGRLGTCSQAAGGFTYAESYYAGGSLDALTAQDACTAAGGSWTPG